MRILIVTLLLLIILSGCGEPSGGGLGYQYLGASERVIVVCDEHSNYTSTVVMRRNITIIVKGRIDMTPWFFVWLNTEKRKLRIRRRHGRMAEYHVLLFY